MDPEKIRAKGVQSVRSRVTTIRPHLRRDISLEMFKKQLLRQLFPDGVEQHVLTQEDLAEVEMLQTQRYDTWDWNYGASPPCDLVRRIRIEGCGTIETHIRLEQGCITDICFRGDFFGIKDPQILAERLKGLRLTREDLRSVLEMENIVDYFSGAGQDFTEAWIHCLQGVSGN